MVRASDCTTVLFDIENINKLDIGRTKELRKSMYKHLGNSQYCCEDRCEIVIETPEDVLKTMFFNENMRIVNEHYFHLMKNDAGLV